MFLSRLRKVLSRNLTRKECHLYDSQIIVSASAVCKRMQVDEVEYHEILQETRSTCDLIVSSGSQMTSLLKVHAIRSVNLADIYRYILDDRN